MCHNKYFEETLKYKKIKQFIFVFFIDEIYIIKLINKVIKALTKLQSEYENGTTGPKHNL